MKMPCHLQLPKGHLHAHEEGGREVESKGGRDMDGGAKEEGGSGSGSKWGDNQYEHQESEISSLFQI